MEIVNNPQMNSCLYELEVEPIDASFSKLLKEGRLKPKRGFNLHHEYSYPGFGNYFSCILLDVFLEDNSVKVSSFVIGVFDGEEIKLKIKKDSILELWEGTQHCGDVKIKEIKLL